MGCECGLNCAPCEDCGNADCECECFFIELEEEDTKDDGGIGSW